MSERRGLATREQQAEQPHRYIDVPVDPGSGALSVQLRYPRDRGVIDLGVFDPHGRFRGYSGGARAAFVLTPEAATPGYLPGPLPAGWWHVFLRLHDVPAEGLPWRLRWSTEPAQPAPLRPPPPVPQRPPGRGLAAPAGRTWLAGDLHAHTVHSDGAATIDELAALAAGRGLDYLAVTDHNTTSHHPHLRAAGRRAGIRLLAGQEVTTAAGHAGALGDVGWVDFREPVDTWVAHVRAAGGVLVLNHPVEGDCSWSQSLHVAPSHVEVWHGSWDGRRRAPLEWWRATGGVPVGGGDLHDPGRGDRPGAPTTWVAAGDGDVLEAIAAGHVAVAEDPRGPALVRVDGTLLAADAVGTRLLPGAAWLAGEAAGGRLVTADRDDLGDREDWHVLLAEDGRVVALSP